MSKKRKGMSLDDKRETLVNIYHERKEPLNLKEIENYGSKQGVVQQSIKDVNQSLVDDNLICSDKIGSGVFFWSFPSKAYQDLLQTEERLKATLSASKESIEKTEREITELAENRQRPDRGRLLEQLTRLQEEEKLLDRELESLKSFDPEHIEKVLKEAKRCKVSADRWTDNVWLIRAYMTRKLGRSSKEADQFLHIDSNFDYIDD